MEKKVKHRNYSGKHQPQKATGLSKKQIEDLNKKK